MHIYIHMHIIIYIYIHTCTYIIIMHELTINKNINKLIKLSVYINIYIYKYKTYVQINAFDWPRSLFHLPGPRNWSSFWALPKSRHGLLLLRVSLCGSATARIHLCGLLGDRLHWLQAFWLPLFQVFTSENYCMFCVCVFLGGVVSTIFVFSILQWITVSIDTKLVSVGGEQDSNVRTLLENWVKAKQKNDLLKDQTSRGICFD